MHMHLHADYRGTCVMTNGSYNDYLQVPVWFCIACPIILGLLAPFVFNLGFGAVAEAVCEHYQLPQQECNDLW